MYPASHGIPRLVVPRYSYTCDWFLRTRAVPYSSCCSLLVHDLPRTDRSLWWPFPRIRAGWL